MMTPLGLALAGPVADGLGVGAWYAAGGTACVLTGGLGLFLPSLARIERPEGPLAQQDSPDVHGRRFRTRGVA